MIAEASVGPGLDWPMSGMIDDVRPALAEAVAARRPAVLATLYAVEGGGPRPVGTQMVFGEGVTAGFFSGGCVEGDVALHAGEVLASGAPQRLVYGEGSPFADLRLLCGARIDILLERVTPDDPALTALLERTRARRPAVWRTDGMRRACVRDDGCMAAGEVLKLRREPFGLARRYEPTRRLIVVGGDPTALAIASLGAQSGMETALLRPKGPEGPPPISGVAYHREAAAVALDAIGLDPWTAVAVATHELEADEDALVAALPSPAAYVGVLGARRRIPERLARLRARGVGDNDLQRLRAPIGLSIGGRAPWPVAVSVIGEIMQQSFAEATAHG